MDTENFLTLKDLAARMNKGNVQAVAETLSQSNPIIKDMPLVECNDKTGYKSTVRTGLPETSWRKLNYGVKQSKGTVAQVRDACGMLEAYSFVDDDLYRLAGDKAQFLKSESDSYLEAMTQNWASTIFYGDTAEHPERFQGLGVRYSQLKGKAPSVKNVIDAGSEKETGNQSVWLVGWAPDKVFGIYPEGSNGGVEHEYAGKKTVQDEDGGHFEAHQSHFKVNTGLAVRDWRYVVRICNIDVETIDRAKLLQLMVTAKRRIPNLDACRPVWYASRDVATLLELGLMEKGNLALTVKQAADGLDEIQVSRIPLHECDALEKGEAKVK